MHKQQIFFLMEHKISENESGVEAFAERKVDCFRDTECHVPYMIGDECGLKNMNWFWKLLDGGGTKTIRLQCFL